MKKITIGVACNRVIKPATFQCLLELTKSKFDLEFIVATEGYTIAENRAYIAHQAIRNGSEYLLFIDDDMVFPKDTLKKLIFHDKAVVGVVCHSRMKGTNTTVVLEDGTILHDDKIPKETLIKCQHVGTGIMLIKMDVFKNIKEPWFKFTNLDNGFTTMGEDAWFCQQCRERGYDIFCDTKLKIGHIGEYEYS